MSIGLGLQCPGWKAARDARNRGCCAWTMPEITFFGWNEGGPAYTESVPGRCY